MIGSSSRRIHILNKKGDVKRGVAAVFGATAQPESTSDGDAVQTPRKSNQMRPATSTETSKAGSLPQAGRDYLAQSDARCSHLTSGKVKATYYLDPTLVRRMKHLAVDLKKKDSDIVAEGLLEIIKKYEREN